MLLVTGHPEHPVSTCECTGPEADASRTVTKACTPAHRKRLPRWSAKAFPCGVEVYLKPAQPFSLAQAF